MYEAIKDWKLIEFLNILHKPHVSMSQIKWDITLTSKDLFFDHPILLGGSNQGGCDGWGKYRIWERKEIYAKFWEEDMKVKCHLDSLAIDGRVILKLVLKKSEREDWIYLA